MPLSAEDEKKMNDAANAAEARLKVILETASPQELAGMLTLITFHGTSLSAGHKRLHAMYNRVIPAAIAARTTAETTHPTKPEPEPKVRGQRRARSN